MSKTTMRLFGLLALCLLLAGCAPTTLQTLRDNPQNRATLTADQPWRDVYRLLKERAIDTYAVQAAFLDSELYEDLHRGDIRLIFDSLHQVYIQVAPLAENKTRITVSYAPAESRGIVGNVADWLSADYQPGRTLKPVLGIGIHAEGDIH